MLKLAFVKLLSDLLTSGGCQILPVLWQDVTVDCVTKLAGHVAQSRNILEPLMRCRSVEHVIFWAGALRWRY